MSERIHTGLYHIDITDVDFNVAHLYEHLLINTFRSSLESHGFSKYLFGWISGETFQQVMFIEYGFYSSEVESLFITFMGKLSQRIDMSLLHQELRRIEAEDYSLITDMDKEMVIRQLKKLDSLEMIHHRDDFKPKQFEPPQDEAVGPIRLKRSKKDFRDVAVVFGVEHANEEEVRLFLRLRPLVMDAIDTALFANGAYTRDTSSAAGNPDTKSLAALSIYTIRRSLRTTKELESDVMDALNALKEHVMKHPVELQSYIDKFVSTPNWHTFPIEYYRYTGMLTSKQSIAKAFTPEAVKSLLDRMEINVSTAQPTHWDAIHAHS